MSKTSFVLQALKILGSEEILKLSEALHHKSIPVKKAAGEDLVVWNEAPEAPKRKESAESTSADILIFPERPKRSEEDEQEHTPGLMASELIFWQREMSKHTGEVQKSEALKEYKKSTNVYMVQTVETDGKKSSRSAATEGVLINKKQA